MSEVDDSGRTFEVYRKNDAQYLYMAMKAKTTGWISVGLIVYKLNVPIDMSIKHFEEEKNSEDPKDMRAIQSLKTT